MSAPTKITLIRGDGIGPEIMEAVVSILEAARANLAFDEIEIGLASIEKHGQGVTEEALEVLRKNKIALKSPTTTPVGGGHKSVNVTLRKALDLFVNVRPCRSLPGIETPFKDIDLVIVRENIEDTYAGIEYMQSEDMAQCLRITTKSESLRTHRFAFELAKTMGRAKIACIHKANIMKITDGLFLNTFRDLAKNYPDLQSSDVIVDNCCMQLVSKPQQFDVLVLPNLFGDIVSDLCAGLIGGLGIAAGANIGEDCAVFEAVHGSAPDIAGKGLANPTALLQSAILMLRHMGKLDIARRIEKSLTYTLNDPTTRTRDLKGTASTTIFAKAVIANLG
jgi:isocitrate dehydrogenase (NAD+)